jgi:hypothetical protein
MAMLVKKIRAESCAAYETPKHVLRQIVPTGFAC